MMMNSKFYTAPSIASKKHQLALLANTMRSVSLALGAAAWLAPAAAANDEACAARVPKKRGGSPPGSPRRRAPPPPPRARGGGGIAARTRTDTTAPLG